MPIKSKAQARFEFAHPEKFDKKKVAAKVREAGGMDSMPEILHARMERRHKKGFMK